MKIAKYIEKKIKQQIEACEKARKLEEEIDNWCNLSGIEIYNKEYKETKGKLIDAISPINEKRLNELINKV